MLLFFKQESGHSPCTASQHFPLLNHFHLCCGKTAHFLSFTLDKSFSQIEHRSYFVGIFRQGLNTGISRHVLWSTSAFPALVLLLSFPLVPKLGGIWVIKGKRTLNSTLSILRAQVGEQMTTRLNCNDI